MPARPRQAVKLAAAAAAARRGTTPPPGRTGRGREEKEGGTNRAHPGTTTTRQQREGSEAAPLRGAAGATDSAAARVAAAWPCTRAQQNRWEGGSARERARGGGKEGVPATWAGRAPWNYARSREKRDPPLKTPYKEGTSTAHRATRGPRDPLKDRAARGRGSNRGGNTSDGGTGENS